MSRSKIFRLPQIYKTLHHSFSGYRCSGEAPRLIHNFVGTNSTRNGWGLSYEFRVVMTRCELSTGSFAKCGRFLPVRSPSLERSCSVPGLPRQYATHADREQKSKKMLLYLTGLVFAMVGCSYAAVPLYRRFCQATGYGGTVQRRESVEEKIARHAQEGTVTTREVVVQFNADVADGMPWKFLPTQREVRVKPGESALAFYTAENRSSTPITGVSTYNITPMKAAVYFNKIQCFCFEEQRLLPGEQIDMPVFFYIDPEFETDPKMDGINNLILSYTFFKVSEE
ncbi:Cytochrome c oxidase assembly protein [Actinidia chinensis var. chinensis]|uniref:Cytochrome c oxidase assembly protein n=1 Tax=Actinidia chinensis var. chinensis TaxID=1590841 RepID=A0A2R6S2Z9_ACTCC|nr:Cytochrome c oxidase assembly protein [Actinidia chinensis var. chinensis]